MLKEFSSHNQAPCMLLRPGVHTPLRPEVDLRLLGQGILGSQVFGAVGGSISQTLQDPDTVKSGRLEGSHLGSPEIQVQAWSMVACVSVVLFKGNLSFAQSVFKHLSLVFSSLL